ncbi:MAG: BrnA antitoxin family protein [Mesorhizobium sp.]|nr:BrnA antitoxin family protein [Mesorhizobium sp.]
MSNKPLTNEAGEVRELTAADMKRMKPASDVLPAELVAALPKRKRGQRGPAKRAAKESITLRLDPEIVQHFRGTGPGWQSRINRTLKDAISRA